MSPSHALERAARILAQRLGAVRVAVWSGVGGGAGVIVSNPLFVLFLFETTPPHRPTPLLFASSASGLRRAPGVEGRAEQSDDGHYL